jgi:hypothetical protein
MVSTTLSVETAAALRKGLAMPPNVAPSRRQTKLLPDDFGDFIENREDVDRRAGCYFVCFAIVDVIRKIFEFRKMLCIVPSAKQFPVMIGPVIAICNYCDFVFRILLYVFGNFQNTFIGES